MGKKILKEKIKNALKTEFTEQEIDLESKSNGKIIGFVISDKFKEMNDFDRQKWVWNILDENLELSEKASIAILLTLTDKESEAYRS